MNDLQKEILIGLMLGDGGLRIPKGCKNASLHIVRQRSDKKYLEYHADIFSNLFPKIYNQNRYDKRTNKTYYASRLQTRVSPELTEWYHKWYPNGKKIVPKDITLTPRVLATWFADDGCIIIKPGCRITLATNGFALDEVKMLQNKLDNFNVRPKISKAKSGWILRDTKVNHVKLFTDMIDPVFPEGMERKRSKWRKNQDYLSNIIERNIITDATKKEIVNLWKLGVYTKQELADEFGFHIRTIYRIITGRR